MSSVTFAQSALGKTVKVALWTAVSAVVGVVLAGLAGWHLPANVAWLIPVINTILVALKNLADKNTQNLPTVWR